MGSWTIYRTTTKHAWSKKELLPWCFVFLDLKYPRGTIWHTPTEDLPKRKNALQEIGETTGNTQKHHGICHGVYQKLPPQYEGIKRMSNNSAELLMDPRHVSFPFLSNVVQGGKGGYRRLPR
jgi:hypothetical protein